MLTHKARQGQKQARDTTRNVHDKIQGVGERNKNELLVGFFLFFFQIYNANPVQNKQTYIQTKTNKPLPIALAAVPSEDDNENKC